MKLVSMFLLLILTACSSYRVQHAIPSFSKAKVCSSDALTYLNKKHLSGSENIKIYSDGEIHSLMLSLEPAIRKCYENEMERKNTYDSFNLCFVVGFSPMGEMEFFEFSTSEIEISKDFKSCLSELKKKKELIGFKGLSILQPYRLFPKR